MALLLSSTVLVRGDCFLFLAWMETETYRPARMILLGEDASPDARRATSLGALVTPSAPPFFLWHTAEDSYVPPEHTYRLAAAPGRRRPGSPNRSTLRPGSRPRTPHHLLETEMRMWRRRRAGQGEDTDPFQRPEREPVGRLQARRSRSRHRIHQRRPEPGTGRPPGHRRHPDPAAGHRTAPARRRTRPTGPHHGRQARRPRRPRPRGGPFVGLRHVRQQRRHQRQRAMAEIPVDLVRRTFETNVFSRRT